MPYQTKRAHNLVPAWDGQHAASFETGHRHDRTRVRENHACLFQATRPEFPGLKDATGNCVAELDGRSLLKSPSTRREVERMNPEFANIGVRQENACAVGLKVCSEMPYPIFGRSRNQGLRQAAQRLVPSPY
jgi:hypothetical protein